MSNNRSDTKVVLFDLDDTLFDHRGTTLRTLEVLRKKHKELRTRTLQELEARYSELLEEIWIDVLRGKMSVEESRIIRFQLLVEWCGNKIDREEAEQFATEYRQLYLDLRTPVEGASELLSHLRQSVRIGIVTNNFVQEQRDKLLCCGLNHLVDFMVTSEEVGVPKPEPDIFHAALEVAGCKAHQVVMVGDIWETDIIGATRVGIRGVWFNRLGLSCPDTSLAAEIRSLIPAREIADTILSAPIPHNTDAIRSHR